MKRGSSISETSANAFSRSVSSRHLEKLAGWTSWLFSAQSVLVPLCLVYVGIAAPLYAWDLIGYVGNALVLSGIDAAQAHSLTFELLRAELPGSLFTEYTTMNEYRRTVYSDSVAFTQQLPFYAGRIAYYGLMTVGSCFGVTLVASSVYVSVIATATAVFWMTRFANTVGGVWTCALIPWIAICLGAAAVARTSTPDSLAFLAVTAVVVLYWQRKWRTMMWLAIPGAILVRSDLLFLTASLSICVTLFGKGRALRGEALLAVLLQVGIAYGLHLYGQHPGFQALIRFALLEGTPYPLMLERTLSAAEYLKAMGIGLRFSITEPGFQLFAVMTVLLLAAIAILARTRGVPRDISTESQLVVALSLTAVARFITFPLALDRLYLPIYCFVALCLFSVLRKTLAEGTTSSIR